MSKKRILTLFLVLVCVAAVLTGCAQEPAQDEQQPAQDVLLLAKDKATNFTIVSYLEDNQVVKEFAADLLIKSRAKFPIVSEAEAGASAIYIGTPEKLKGKGGTKLSMTYTNYEIIISEGNIYVCFGMESMAEDVLTMLKDTVQKNDDGSCTLPKEMYISKDICEISEVVPMFKTNCGTMRDLHDVGNGNYMASYYDMDEFNAPGEIAAYEAHLADHGYTLWQENEIEGSRFATYYKGDTLIHLNYFKPMGDFRIVYGPKTYLPENSPIENYEKKVTPSVSIIEGTENVLCMVIQTADGHFYVIDGGWDSVSKQTKTLNAGAHNERVIEYTRDSEKDMEVLYKFMRRKTPDGGKPQVTWMITHADPDHILLPARFFKDYAGKFDMDTIVYNFPNLFNIGLGQSGGSTNDPTVMTSYAENFLNRANEYYPEANHFVYHAGQKYYIPGGEIEFLFAASEDFWPNKMPWMNHTSGVWRFTIEGKTIMITGDAEKGICNQMVGVFGPYLKSDILQVNHHGANGATLPFYRRIDPTVCFWACQQYHLDYDNRQTGVATNYEFNKFLRTSEKVIGHYSNTETHTVLLPSLEEA